MIANFDRTGLQDVLADQAAEAFNEQDCKLFNKFVDAFLSHYPLDAWQDRPVTDLFGCCFGLWHRLQEKPVPEPRVHVFNPSLEEDRWVCGHTVVVALHEDMPFLVDSLRLELQRQEAHLYTIKSTVLGVKRDDNGKVVDLVIDARKSLPAEYSKEALIYVEINLHTDEQHQRQMQRDIRDMFADVRRVVTDYEPMLECLQRARQNLESHNGRCDEILAFMDWLEDSHFSFLGFREFDFIHDERGSALEEKTAARLGIFTKLDEDENRIAEDDFSDGMRNFYESDDVICFSKSSTRSNVHRGVYPDYIVVKKLDAEGNTVGEYRFLGLFTYAVYSISPTDIPLVRKKVQTVLERSGLDPHSHDGKNLRRIIENFPRDELFQSDLDTLAENISSVASINERHVVRLIMRYDPFGNFVNCLVYVPREVYTTRIRQKIEALIGSHLGSGDCDSTTYFSESILARAQIVFRLSPDHTPDYDREKIESAIAALTRNWDDCLQSALIEHYGESRGITLLNRYQAAFSSGYQENFDARTAVHDIEMAESLDDGTSVAMNFYQPVGSDPRDMRFRVQRRGRPLELSDVIPVLEHLGLRVIGEKPYKIEPGSQDPVWLHDFELHFGLDETVDVHAARNLFEEAFSAIWHGHTESDSFNKLVLGARLNWREVNLLRVYASYMKQTGFNTSQSYIAATLARHLGITRNLIALFKAYFDPRMHKSDKSDDQRVERLRNKILGQLDEVANLNEDRVLRRYLEMFEGTQRTNFFQKQENGEAKDYISLKLAPRSIPGIPKPRPLYEIFMYSPRVEGVHLRGGKVARGGLRWSDRQQDYRTEVLGLVKAQQVKNAVIVPNGAKGGFVAKKVRTHMSRDEFIAEGVNCYKTFIRALLDVTDNIVGGEVVPPQGVVRRDDDDPYLVVAADKGTATFSDTANEISAEYGHWLGDAFASGGSQGYDHKGMGITAKGAWVSVQRHFREKGLDIQREDFTVVGIGDMAGDVFGNGMLLSEHIRLVGAFNHMHIFVDPSPDAKKSFKERERLFNTPRTTWEDYNSKLISKGGGVFSRDAKSIDITPEMQDCFGLTESRLTPNELISAMLKAPVDLLWNGGIGTYVKSSQESHGAIGDKANDSLRVDGAELRCRVFGEGGNLGMSQLGRVEYCLHGGACNTDFIDNAGGVDCSDHEVNIKILLDGLVDSGDLTTKQRNQLLEKMTDSVSELVLKNNYRQTQAISIARFQVAERVNEYRRFINYLEQQGKLDRKLEFLPSDEEIVERHAHGRPLTRPELSVLVSYAKVVLKDELIHSDIADDPHIAREVETAFPATLSKKYRKDLYQHKLLREIVGTQVANDLINNLGITAGHRLKETTGAAVNEIARAYIVSRDVFEFEEFQQYVQSLDNAMPAEFQAELLTNMVRRVRRGTRWFLRNRRSGIDTQQEIERFRDGLEAVGGITEMVIEGQSREDWLARRERLLQRGVPEKWAARLAMPANLFSGLGIVEAALAAEVSNEEVTRVFYLLLDKLKLNWFASQLSEVSVESYWQALARESYIDDLEAQVRKLVISLVRLKGENDWQTTLDAWAFHHSYLIERWKGMVTEVEATQSTDYAMFSVALRELIDLAQATEHCQGLT